jgi:putative pyruvate formate lyase activating enzyme
MKYMFPELSDCHLCPRACHADRNAGEKGYCNSGSGFHISSICIHRGEEPPVSGEQGICNVFFSHCNMQCIYCQNHQISKNTSGQPGGLRNFDEIIARIIACLDGGCRSLGFVSPSHVTPHVRAIINALRGLGRNPVTVYNSNGFDSVDELKKLEGLIDIYLPDLKYAAAGLAAGLSDTPAYPLAAQAAIREMFRQKGSSLHVDGGEYAVSGMIIRHLVLPGYPENTEQVLRWIAAELSPDVHVSLMGQYYPDSGAVAHPKLGRTLHPDEYAQAVELMEELGMHRGWLQEISSHDTYRPDFQNEHPFE